MKKHFLITAGLVLLFTFFSGCETTVSDPEMLRFEGSWQPSTNLTRYTFYSNGRCIVRDNMFGIDIHGTYELENDTISIKYETGDIYSYSCRFASNDTLLYLTEDLIYSPLILVKR